MTSQPETISAKDRFFDLLLSTEYQAILPEVDAIIVLRNHNVAVTTARFLHAYEIMPQHTELLCMTWGGNTLHEAQQLAEVTLAKRVLLVTSRFHAPRAFLTYLRAMKDVEVYVTWYQPSPVDELMLQEELGKINDYQRKGHVATYEEGLQCLLRTMAGT